MNDEEVKSKLSVGVKKLASDQVDFVKGKIAIIQSSFPKIL
jgi:hypothetical protein